MALYECSKAELKPVVLNGRRVKRIYSWDNYFGSTSDTMQDVLENDCAGSGSISRQAAALIGAVGVIPSQIDYLGSRYLTTQLKVVSTRVAETVYDGVQTKIGYIEFEGVNAANGNQTLYITVYKDSTKTETLLARVSIVSAQTVDYSLMHVIKVNDTLYLIMYARKHTRADGYDQFTGISSSFLTLKNGVVLRSSPVALGGSYTDAAATFNARTAYLLSMADDNTQTIVFQKVFMKTISSGAMSQQWYLNEYQWKSSTAVGLRTTSWTTILNVANNLYVRGFIRAYEGLGVDFSTFNTNTSAEVNNTYYSRNGALYGALLNSYANSGAIHMPQSASNMFVSWNNRYSSRGNYLKASHLRTYGLLHRNSNMDSWLYMNCGDGNSTDGYIYIYSLKYGEIDKANRVSMNSFTILYDDYFGTKLIDDESWRTLIVNEGYLFPSFAFMKEGQLLIGMRKEWYTSRSANQSSYEETIRVMSYTVYADPKTETIEFKFSGVCDGGTFSNKNLPSVSQAPNFSEYLDAHSDEWYYDAFRNYALQYETENSSLEVD